MAVSPTARIVRFSLTSADIDALGAFYGAALGFEPAAIDERGGPAFVRLTGIEGARARSLLLRLGTQEVELVAFTPPGRPYPPESASNDLWFQHMAIVVSDMRSAYSRLSARPGWTPITHPEPQRLPESSGGVVAFKFRDPEGHPLELLEFPPGRVSAAWQQTHRAGPCLGIDHSAIAIADTGRSVGFYERLFGFSVAARSLNRGAEQERLDGLQDPIVEVTALAPGTTGPPHLELLCYRSPPDGRAMILNSNDIAATRLVLAVDDMPALMRRAAQAPIDLISLGVVSLDRGGSALLMRDPDGHTLCLLDQAEGRISPPRRIR